VAVVCTPVSPLLKQAIYIHLLIQYNTRYRSHCKITALLGALSRGHCPLSVVRHCFRSFNNLLRMVRLPLPYHTSPPRTLPHATPHPVGQQSPDRSCHYATGNELCCRVVPFTRAESPPSGHHSRSHSSHLSSHLPSRLPGSRSGSFSTDCQQSPPGIAQYLPVP